MAKERNALKAGTFIAITIVLILGVIVAISGFDAMFLPRQVHKVIFTLHDDIGGLQPGDPVRIGGYTVGTIRSIDVVQGNAADISGTAPSTRQAAARPHTEITISLPRKYVIRENAVIVINGTLIGASWLNFETLGDGQPVAPDAPIVGHPGGMNAAFQQLGDIMPQLKQTIASVNEITLPALNTDLAKFGATADSFTRIAGTGNDAIAHINSNIDPLVEHMTKVAADASSTLLEIKGVAHHADTDIVPNVASFTGTIKDKLPGIMDQVRTVLAEGQKSLESATVALADLKDTFANTKSISGTANDVVSGNKSKLEGMINSLKQTADNLKNASAEIRHSPWRLIYKPGPDEIGNLNIYDAARQFSDGAGALRDSAEALRDASKSKTVTPEELKTLIDKLNSSFDKFNAAEKGLWDAVKE